MKKSNQPSAKWLVLLIFCIVVLSACLIFFPSDSEVAGNANSSTVAAAEESSEPESIDDSFESLAADSELESEIESVSAEDSEEESSEPEPESEPEPVKVLEMPEDIELNAEHAFVYDTRLGLLYVKGDMNESVYEASITKLYTAYVALQILDPSEIVTVGYEVYMVGADSSLAYVGVGNRISVEMLVQGMMMPSGNDAAYALAAAAGRRLLNDSDASASEAVSAFMERMNEAAVEDGLTNSHFVTPDGDHDDDHYTSMWDLIRIAKKAMTNSTIMKYTNCSYAEVTYADGTPASWYNGNQLVHPESQYYRSEVCGLKTGTTDQAGYCLLTAAQWDYELIIGVLGCDSSANRSKDTIKLLDIYESIFREDAED